MMPLLPASVMLYSSCSSKPSNWSLVTMSPASLGSAQTSMPSLTTQPGRMVSFLKLDQPSSVLPSNRSFQPSAFSLAVNWLWVSASGAAQTRAGIRASANHRERVGIFIGAKLPDGSRGWPAEECAGRISYWSPAARSPCLPGMKRHAVHWQMLAALVLATLTALAMRGLFAATDPADQGFLNGALATCAFVGDLFMRALKMIIVPLIVTSVVAGIAGLGGMEGFGRLGAKTAAFYGASSLAAILLGLFLVNTIRPGLTDGAPNEVIRTAFSQSASTATASEREKVTMAGQREAKDFLDIFRAMVPENVLKSATDNGQMLAVIVFSICFALAATKLPAADASTLHG
ncbi:MAG: cation:dicarboxylase symporter family transporter, partial [Alphaproteobacteria bacterium]